jgi:hypothetical protein
MQKPPDNGLLAAVSAQAFAVHSGFSVFHLKFSEMGAYLDIFVSGTPQKNTYGKINTRKRNLPRSLQKLDQHDPE